jgi:hypothetical protein
MKAISDSAINEPLLDDEEMNRLVKFFDVLIEMDFVNKRNEKVEDEDYRDKHRAR